MKISQTQHQTQKQILAPVMQQSIEVLMLPIAELDQAISQAVQENPMLEIQEETSKTQEQKNDIEKFIQHKLRRDFDRAYVPTYESPNDEEQEERPISRSITLEEHLLRQLNLEISDPQQRQIGEMIIGSLDEDGYCSQDSCLSIIHQLHLKNATLFTTTLEKIKHFDPVGIASRNLKECLLAQIEHRFHNGHPAIRKIIEHHLEDLFHKRFQDIAKKLDISLDDVKEISRQVSSLEPKPARKFSPITGEIYIKPDIIVHQRNEDLLIEVNNDHVPRLTINNTYKNFLNDAKLNEEEKEFIRERIKNAALFIKSIEQRGETIKKIAEFIVNKQRDFFTQGHVALRPMILKDVADAIERNESTISRAINNKYMDTPQGLIPMKYFFSQAVTDEDNHTVSNRSIKEAIKEIVDQESKSKPLSDQKILEILKTQNITVARRTISKYREELHILPAHLRKE